MADVKISALPAATTPLDGTEILPIVQGGVTDRVSVADLTAGRTVAAATVNVVANTSSPAVRITQTGAGNALLVEDSASPDATPFVVDASGKVIQGYTASVGFARSTTGGTNATNAPNVQAVGTASGTTQLGTYLYSDTTATAKAGVTLARSRGADPVTRGALVSGDAISGVEFVGDNGTAMAAAATVFGAVDGTPSSDMPGRLVFSTTAVGTVFPAERMRIDSAGDVGIGTTNPTARLNVVDATSQDAVRITQTGTGNALVVEDSANPDSTPFVVTADGNVGIGTTAPTTGLTIVRDGSSQINFIRNSDNASPPFFASIKRRGTEATKVIVNNNDQSLAIQAYGYDGATDRALAEIGAFVDGIPGSGDMPGRLVFSTTADGASSPTERMRINNVGFTTLTGSFGRGAPVTKTGNFTLADTENWIICNGVGSITVTLPAAASWTGREVMLKTIAAQTVVSASSNVVPQASSVAGTAILAASAGAWATLVSDGTNWIIMQS
jgi:hypothetical protein